jgi:hypothetical protein
MPFESISEEDHAAFVASLSLGQYNLLLGAGASMDSFNGCGLLPSGTALQAHLTALKKANPRQPCPSADNLRPIRRFAKRGSGSSGLEFRRPAADAASVGLR